MRGSVRAELKRQTAQHYGWLWTRSDLTAIPQGWHYQKIRALLPRGHLRGLVLDAGCGDGTDAVQLASSDSCWVIGVELSEEGVRQTARRAASYANVSVVQGDLEDLPLWDGVFDFVYCYGVLHHLPHPEQGFQELVRVLRTGGMLAVYVYEDFSTHTSLEQLLLRAVKGVRHVTVRVPPRMLYHLCRMLSPLIFFGLTVPAHLLARATLTKPLSERIPYRHGVSPMSLAADLYDRFAAPIERRYSKAQVERWFSSVGLVGVHVVPLRGWVGYGTKP